MKQYLIAFSITALIQFVCVNVEASSLTSCTYHFQIKEINKDSIAVTDVRFVKSEPVGQSESSCSDQSGISSLTISKNLFEKNNLSRLKKGAKITATWTSYSAMTPKGAISGTSWEIE